MPPDARARGMLMASASQNGFRDAVSMFAALLVVQAAWLLSVELVRPSLPYFPADQSSAATAESKRAQAGLAAQLGLVRGELWVDEAATLAAGAVSELLGFAAPDSPRLTAAAETAARRAARLSPHDPRGWLLLAATAARLDRLNRDIAEPLKMSYFTGANEAALMPLRIRIATRSDIIEDDELQVLVTEDIRTILLHQPALKPAIIAAYRYAVPQGKRFLETTASKLDPAFLAELRAAPAK